MAAPGPAERQGNLPNHGRQPTNVGSVQPLDPLVQTHGADVMHVEFHTITTHVFHSTKYPSMEEDTSAEPMYLAIAFRMLHEAGKGVYLSPMYLADRARSSLRKARFDRFRTLHTRLARYLEFVDKCELRDRIARRCLPTVLEPY